MSPPERYALLVRAFMGRPGVTQGGRGFGATALRTGGRIFAMLSSRDEFVVKLPRARVDELVAAGEGARFEPGTGRVMKEWLAMRPDSTLEWEGLAAEALAHAER